ncbi:MAG: MarR family transcriptional regulator [Candidatus Thermoplasmatota archaeon]|nr:MarR family transcriptional regulator [Candidatus Thermoplasmatota archaeon]
MVKERLPTAAAILLVSLAVSIVILSLPVKGVGTSGIVEIEEDTFHVEVSPQDSGIVRIEVSLRSTDTRNSIFDIVSELDSPPTWSVDIPEKVYLGPLEKKTFTALVRCPLGEIAGTSATLEISAYPEGVGMSWDGEVSSDSCTILVQPYLQAFIMVENDYLLDLPLEGEYQVTVRNDGNTRSPVGILSDGITGISTSGPIITEPGETAVIDVGYELSDVADQYAIVIRAVSGDRVSDEGLEITFIREGEALHLLFRRGPFLIIKPAKFINPEIQRMDLFCLGGELKNVGMEMVDGPDGAKIRTEMKLDLSNLDRDTLSYEISGLDRDCFVMVRGYGFSGETKVVSNELPVRVKADPARSASIPVPIVAGGGAAAASVIMVGSAAYFYSASEVFKYRWLTLALVPLYSFVHDEKVLDHFFRGRLFEYIKEHPGVTFTALKNHFEVNNGTLTYHLHRLEKEELIDHRNLGRYKMFYADGVRIKGCEVVISQMDKDIIELVSRDPGITSAQVLADLRGERSRRTISRHLKQLQRKGFIEVQSHHGERRLFIAGELERVLMPRRGVVEVKEMTSVET